MKYLSLWEKLKVLFDLFMSYKFVLIITAFMLIFTILFGIKKLSGKKYIVSMFISLCVAFIISIVKNHKILANTFDNFTTIFFNGIYFPSIYVYIGIILIVAISFIVSILNKKTNKSYKIANSTMFIFNNILLVLILNIIANNKIDIFSISSLYTNKSLVSMLELNTGLFILWIASIIVIYITNVICSRISLKKEKTIKEDSVIAENIIGNEMIEKPKEDMTFNDILNNIAVTYYDNNTIDNNKQEVFNPQEVYENNYNRLVDTNEEINEAMIIENNEESKDDVVVEISVVPEEVAVMEANEEVNEVITIESNEESKDDVVVETSVVPEEVVVMKTSEEPIIEEINDSSLNDYIKDDKEIKTITNVITSIDSDKYTLDDYKKILKMLKEIRGNAPSNITVDDAVTLSLINDYSVDDCVKFKEILESNLN